MAGKNQTSSTTKNQGGHRKQKTGKASKFRAEQSPSRASHAVGRKNRQPNLGDITRSDANA